MKKFTVVSAFDGVSCARVALQKNGMKVEKYYASEIEAPAMRISAENFPDIIQLGNIQNVSFKKNALIAGAVKKGEVSVVKKYQAVGKKFEVDLLIGGSPCQDLSIANTGRKGLKGKRSGLFFEYVRLLHELKPKYFVLENVKSMKQDAKDRITKELGVEPIMINANLVSAQNRKRLFWTNIKGVTLPKDKEIYLKDIIEEAVDEKYFISDKTLQTILNKLLEGKPIAQGFRIYDIDGKSVALRAVAGDTGAKTGLYILNWNGEEQKKSNTLRVGGRGSSFGDKHNFDQICIVTGLTERRTEECKKLRKEMTVKTGKDFSPRRMKEIVPRTDGKANTLTTQTSKDALILLLKNKTARIRRLTPTECERLQGLPDGYTAQGGGFRQSALQGLRKRLQCGRRGAYPVLHS